MFDPVKKLNITEKQVLNLELLAIYLKGLGSNYEKFEMNSYMLRREKHRCTNIHPYQTGRPAHATNLTAAMNHCGTSACAVGHAASLGELKDPDGIFKDFKIQKESSEQDAWYESWREYSERVFGLNSIDDCWDWCFGSRWTSIDNTPTGAAKRIMWLITKGLPKKSIQQRLGQAPLCYK